MSKTVEVIDLTVDFPFDLNGLFNLTYSFDILKQAIEFLAKNQALQAKQLSSLQGLSPNFQTESNQIDDNDKNSNKQGGDSGKMLRDHDNIIKNLRHELNQLKDQINNHDKLHQSTQKDLDKHTKAIEDLQKTLQDHDKKLSGHDSTIQLLKTLGAPTVNTGNEEEGQSTSPSIIDSLEKLVENLRKECYAKFATRDESASLRKRIDSLENEMIPLKEEVSNHSINISQCRDITDQNKLDIDDLKRLFKDLKKLSPNQSSQPDINASPSASSLGNKDIDSILKKLKKLKDELDKKLDINEFHNEIARLREMIGNSVSDDQEHKIDIKQNTGPQINNNQFNSKEVTKLKEITEKYSLLEESHQKIINDMKNLNLQMIKDQIAQIHKLIEKSATKDQFFSIDGKVKETREIVDKNSSDIKELQDLFNAFKNSSNNQPGGSVSANDIIIIRNRMEYAESQMSQLKKQFVELKKFIEEGKEGQEVKNINMGIDDNMIKDLETELNNLRAEFQKFKDDTGSNMKGIQEHLKNKIDKEELAELEARLLEKLNEMLKKLLGQFADKSDTKKRLVNLEKNVKNILELIMSRGGQGGKESEEDAMFTKKPLGGMSCASCERNINNLHGQMADYQPWKKLPFREPSERIARYGPGFSKILSMIRPDQIDQSRMEQVQHIKRSVQEDFLNTSNHNNSTIQEHSILVEMPSQISAKNSARTGNHFYKPSYSGNKTVVMKQYHGMEESPPRIMNHENSAETLPTLNIKGSIQRSGQGQLN